MTLLHGLLRGKDGPVDLIRLNTMLLCNSFPIHVLYIATDMNRMQYV
jgi:hypothetical protein